MYLFDEIYPSIITKYPIATLIHSWKKIGQQILRVESGNVFNINQGL